jgi:two-component system, chemotaxis family, CheB/CheR fusion protein
VFWNLLKNAIKFTPHGGCVGVRCRPDGDMQVKIEINDTGVGIEPKDIPRLFNAFAQADRAITRQFGGLGLGLAISKSLVEMHGGTIEARSEGKGRGATFSVRLPLVSVARGSLSAGQGKTQEATLDKQRRVLRLLLVEDHGDTAEMIELFLSSEGYQVRRAGDVATALDMATAGTFDLLISDLGLPDGSGIDLMRELRSRGSKLRGIALSGYGQDQDIQQSHEAGFAAHILKPVDMDHFLAVLEEVGSADEM